MNIIVCVKQVPDPEAPPGSFKLDPAGKEVLVPREISWVISPYDENAVEAALQLKDKHGGKVTLLTMGPPTLGNFLQDCMATGADDAVLVSDPSFQGGDAFSTAYVLAKAIERIGAYDLVLCGRQAADTDAGMVGPCIAEFLDLPCATIVRKIEVADRRVNVERVVEEGIEQLELPLPAVLAVTSELFTPRYPSLFTSLAAAERQPPIWTAQDIGVDPSQVGAAGAYTRRLRLSLPVSEVKCQIMEGETLEERAENLAAALRAAKII